MKLIFTLIICFSAGLSFISECRAQWTSVTYNNSSPENIIYHNNILFSSCYSGIFKSINNGVTWIKISNGRPSKSSLVSNGSTLFYFTPSRDSLYSSADNGNSWIGKRVISDYQLGCLYASGNILYSGSEVGIYRSTDYGTTWAHTLNSFVYILSFTSLNSDLYAGSNNGLYKSTNNGLNWFSIGLQVRVIRGIESNGQNLVALVDSSSSNKFYVSSNGGSSWSFTPVVEYGLYNLIYAGNSFYAAGNGHIYKSSNGGFNWSTLPQPIGFSGATALCKVGSRLFAGDNQEDIYYTEDDGQNWERRYAYLRKSNALILSGNLMFAATPNGVFVSPSTSPSWSQTSLNYVEVFSLGVSSGRLFAGTKNLGILYSDDNGNNWTQSSLNNKSVLSFVTVGNKTFAGTASNGLYLSTDLGVSWVQTSFNNQSVNCIISFNSALYCGTENNGIFISTDTGISWSQTAYNNRTIYSMHASDGNLYAGTFQGGLIKSTNQGQAWTQFSFAGKTVKFVSSYQNYLFCGVYQEGGFQVTSNGGQSWIPKNSGLTFSVVMDPNCLLIAGTNIYMGVIDASIWKTTIVYLTTTKIDQIGSSIPDNFKLLQNYPNPFNPQTKINFNISKASFVELIIYNSSGREVETLANEKLSAGSYEITWNAANLPSGIYFYKLSTENFSETRKMILLK